MKIALSFSASIDAGVVVVVKAPRRGGYNIFRRARRGTVILGTEVAGIRYRADIVPEALPVRHLQEQLPRLKSMIFVWIARRAARAK